MGCSNSAPMPPPTSSASSSDSPRFSDVRPHAVRVSYGFTARCIAVRSNACMRDLLTAALKEFQVASGKAQLVHNGERMHLDACVASLHAGVELVIAAAASETDSDAGSATSSSLADSVNSAKSLRELHNKILSSQSEKITQRLQSQRVSKHMDGARVLFL